MLRDRLDPGAIRCISFMGEKFMHLYNLQNNISDGVGLAPMQLDMCTIKERLTPLQESRIQSGSILI